MKPHWLLPLVLLLAACGPAASVVVHASAPHGPPLTSKASACPGRDGQHLRAGADVVDAYVCSSKVRPIAGDGRWQVDTVSRVTSGLQALLTTYGRPDASRGGGDCAAVGYGPGTVWIHRADGAVQAARAPFDTCGGPGEQARAALAALGLDEVSAVEVRQVSTQLAADSGCGDLAPDPLAQDGGYTPGRPSAARLRPVPRGTWLCSYRDGGTESGQRTARLLAARRLSAAEVQAISSGLEESRVDPSCSHVEQTTFALLQPPAGGLPTAVALDGCGVRQGGTAGWWRGSGGLRSLLG